MLKKQDKALVVALRVRANLIEGKEEKNVE